MHAFWSCWMPTMIARQSSGLDCSCAPAPPTGTLPAGIVIANREFEAWSLAAAESLAGRRGLRPDLQAPADPESIRDAKGWLSQRMSARYSGTIDQPALAATMDLALARERSPSFDKLVRDLERLLR